MTNGMTGTVNTTAQPGVDPARQTEAQKLREKKRHATAAKRDAMLAALLAGVAYLAQTSTMRMYDTIAFMKDMGNMIFGINIDQLTLSIVLTVMQFVGIACTVAAVLFFVGWAKHHFYQSAQST